MAQILTKISQPILFGPKSEELFRDFYTKCHLFWFSLVSLPLCHFFWPFPKKPPKKFVVKGRRHKARGLSAKALIDLCDKIIGSNQVNICANHPQLLTMKEGSGEKVLKGNES